MELVGHFIIYTLCVVGSFTGFIAEGPRSEPETNIFKILGVSFFSGLLIFIPIEIVYSIAYAYYF